MPVLEKPQEFVGWVVGWHPDSVRKNWGLTTEHLLVGGRRHSEKNRDLEKLTIGSVVV